MSLSYNNSWHGVSYSLSYSMNKNTSDSDENGESVTHDNQFALSVSVPLDHWMHNTWATYNLNNSQDGATQNIGLNGTALVEDNLNWNIQEGVSNTGSGNSTSMNADYKGTYGEVSGGVSQDSHQRSVNVGLQGGVVAHANGITLTQPLGETIALVKHREHMARTLPIRPASKPIFAAIPLCHLYQPTATTRLPWTQKHCQTMPT